MTTFGPNDIAACIYWVGGWGPLSGGKVNDADKIKVTKWLDIAIAVCLAESGGVLEARNGEYIYGLWQINTKAHPAIAANAVMRYSTNTITHPLANTAAARDIYTESSGWNPWSSFKNDSYKKHLGHGKAAYAYISKKENLEAFKTKLAGLGFPIVTVEAGEFNGGILGPNFIKANLSEEGSKITDALNPNSWIGPILTALKQSGIAVGVFLVGAVVLILGAWFLLSRTQVGKIAKGPAGLAKDALKK